MSRLGTSDTAICTIVARNYLPYARVLCASFLQHNPDGRCFVLIIDELEKEAETNKTFESVTLDHLSINNASAFCFKYDVTELSTALKPHLLDFLIKKRGVERLLYLDPDILVTGSLSELFRQLSDHDVIITPHLDTDFPDSIYLPNLRSMLLTGAFNLGFLGIRRSEIAANFLHWFKAKTEEFCLLAPGEGLFVDQKLFDVAITLFPEIFIERDTGYNVGPWNIHSRQLRKEGDTWLCNEGPLHFYHFSHYDPDRPGEIASYFTRYSLSERLDLKAIYDLYSRLLRSEGYNRGKLAKYGHGSFNNGDPITNDIRKHYRMLPSRASISDPFACAELRRLNRLFLARARAKRFLLPIARPAKRLMRRVHLWGN
ncbi:MAG: hypothetical protein ACR2ID_07610 [Chthoniobacterales bacterium]